MVVDERTIDEERERYSHQERSETLDPEPVPTSVVREVASGLKSLSKVLPYEEYANVVFRIAAIRWQCQLAASRSPRRDDDM